MTSRYYELSEEADRDLEEIIRYSLAEFGLEQTRRFAQNFENLFLMLAQNPGLGRKRDEIKLGLQSIINGNYVIFFRVIKNKIRIIRVLHGSRDLPKQF